jgi:hypothetical protein
MLESRRLVLGVVESTLLSLVELRANLTGSGNVADIVLDLPRQSPGLL